MHIVLVHIHVKPQDVPAFIEATKDNTSHSIQEAGVMRFDFFQQRDDSSRFTLVEVYQSPDAHMQHRETAHYLRWRDTVANMMDEPRQGIAYTNILPTDAEWK